MEAIQHGHLMHSIVGIGSGDDEMMDSDYDHAVQQDDDYDIEIDGGEAYSNTGDDEMKFDIGEETMTYDHDDLMLDEGEYQSSTIQEEMIISETQPLNDPFPNIEMSTTSTTEIDHSHITQPDTLGIPLSSDIAETQLSQDATQDIHADTFILSQHVPAITLEVPHKPAVAHQVQEVSENIGEIAENTQLESSGEVEQNTIHSSNENQPGELDAEYKSTEAIQAGQAGHDENAGIEADTNSGTVVLDLGKIHPIIVQFESNTLSLFNSEHYLNLSALDNSQSAYPEVPSVFLLQDVSFYTKGFDELFGVLREMFGATIGDDAEITMEFEGLELFLQEDNLLSKSISLSDLMDLYIRLSKQDGSERPDPLYGVLSTQARFTKRYSELLSAAGEGKGLSQVCTYNQSNDLPPTNHLTPSPTDQGQAHAANAEIARNDEDHQPKSPIEVKELGSNENPDESVQRQLPESNESKPPTDVGETEKEVAKIQAAAQENSDADNGKDRYGEEEELLPAEGEEDEEEKESRIDENSADSTAIQPATATDNATVSIEDATSTDSLRKEEYIQEAPEPQGGNDSGVGEQEEKLGEEATADTEEQVAEEKQEVQVVVEIESAVEEVEAAEYLHQPTEIDPVPIDGNIEQEKGSTSQHAQEAEEESDGFYAEGEQDVGEQDAPVVVDTVYHPRGQSFNAEELLDYEEEEETSPFSEITGEVDHTEEAAQSTEKQGDSPVAASSSVPAAPNDDDDSFSSATVVGTGEEAQSPGNSETSPHSNIAQTQSRQAEIDTEHHHIDVYQYNEEEASADFDNTEVQDEEEEAENQGPYTIQETFVYNNETWQGDDSGDYLQEESYYTAVVEQEEYANGQFEDQDPSVILTHGEDLGEGSVPENYDHGEENLEYPEGQGYGDEDYEEYQEDEEEDYEKYQEGEESTEYKTSHRSRSPSGKRHREEENDILDVQDIKRTRST